MDRYSKDLLDYLSFIFCIFRAYFITNFTSCLLKTPGSLAIERDAFGNVTAMKGVSAEMLDWMENAFNLT